MSDVTASFQQPYTVSYDPTSAIENEFFNEKGELKMTDKPTYKYSEDYSLMQIQDYIDSTYVQHYVGNGDIQTVDFWESLGSIESTSRDTAIKYLARYGKKGGKNKKDLLKAAHYIILMMYAHDKEASAQ